MVSLIVDDKSYEFDPYSGSFTGEEPFSPGNYSTSLIVALRELPINELTFAIGDISQIPPAALCGSLVYSAEKLLNKFGEREPLLSLGNEFQLTSPEYVKLLPLVFFLYCNTTPFAIELMSEWLQEEGYPAIKAGDLAMAVYTARVEKDDHSLIERSDLPIDTHSSPDQIREEIGKIFARSDFSQISFAYDLFSFHKSHPKNQQKDYLLTDFFTETGLLLQDHDNLVLGLGINLLELIGIADSILPALCNFIRNEYFVWERSLMSLGSLLMKTDHRILELIMKDVKGGAIFFKDNESQYTYRHLSDIQPNEILNRPMGNGLPVYLILNY